MNIAIGKLGRAMYFDKKSWSIYAGDDSPLIFYFTLARQYPQHKFYILGASDFTKYKQSKSIGFNAVKNDIPSNIIDVFNDAKAWDPSRANPKDKNAVGNERWRLLDDYIENQGLKFDYGLFMQGPDMSMDIPNVGIKCINKPGLAHPLEMASNYSAPIIYQINKQRFPWDMINEDPRYVPPNTRDILWDENVTYSQIQTDKYTVKRLNEYDTLNFRNHKMKFLYSGIERMFLADKKKIDFSDPDHVAVGNDVFRKNNKFILTLNDGADRLEYLEKWVLNIHPEIKVYGKWDAAAKKKHPDTFIEKGIVQMEPEMWESMFTYIPTFTKSRTNFVTQKPWKMIYYGIIPFYDKNSYDTDHYYKDFPDYVKVTTPKEMWEKIDYLYDHRDEYRKLLKQFYDLLEDKYFNGEFIKETFGPAIDRRAQELGNTRRIING